MNWRTKTENNLQLMGESITRNPLKVIKSNRTTKDATSTTD